MKSYQYVGKNEEELINQALTELNCQLDEIIVSTTTKKANIFKGNQLVLNVYKIDDIATEIKNYLEEILNNMGITSTFEINIFKNQINIKMNSTNNNILIGRNGKTLSALQVLIRQHIYQQINVYPYIILDVENYKEKQEKNLEYLAKKIAREVSKTHQPVIMDNMNSYERRIVHNVISKFSDVTSISEGIEPHRHIVVKMKED